MPKLSVARKTHARGGKGCRQPATGCSRDECGVSRVVSLMRTQQEAGTRKSDGNQLARTHTRHHFALAAPVFALLGG